MHEKQQPYQAHQIQPLFSTKRNFSSNMLEYNDKIKIYGLDIRSLPEIICTRGVEVRLVVYKLQLLSL